MVQLLWSLSAFAEPFGSIALQGSLTAPDGAPLTGAREVSVGLYASESGGAPLWSDSPTWTFHDGAFAASLGETNDLDLATFASVPDVWIEIAVDGVAASRLPVGYVPRSAYAIRAGDAATLDGATRADLTYDVGTGLARTGNTFAVDADWLTPQFRPANWQPSWNNLTDRPATLLDGDQDTTYTRGAGLTLSGTQFAVDAAWLASQTRASTWVPAWSDVTGKPTAGAGLVQSSTQIWIDEYANGPLIPNARFQSGDLTGWTFHSGGGVVKTVTDGAAGPYVLENNPGSVTWISNDARIPIRAGQNYRVSGAFRRTDTTGTIGTYYLVVRMFDASGNNIAGDGTWWYYPVNGDFLSDTAWRNIYADFGPAFNRDFPANAVTMSVGAILNYSNSANRTYQTTNLQIRTVEGGAETVDQEVFRVASGSFTTSSRSWVSHVATASGTLRVGQRPFSYLMNLTGDWTDAEGKHMVYRIRLNRAGDATNYYLPSSAGHNRYIYVTEKRLEEFTMSGVGRLPAGQYTAQLEVMINSSTTQPYFWDAGYGPITFQVW